MDEIERWAHIHIRNSECKGCRFCVEICPKRVYEMTTTYNEQGYRVPHPSHEEECIVCRRCETACPDLAIYIERVNTRLMRLHASPSSQMIGGRRCG